MTAAPLWTTEVAIRFAHCDPAGIVYFASQFDILNGVVEDWFVEALGLPYHDIVGTRRVGLGYAHASADFRLPARMGDRLVYAVSAERIGQKSLPLKIKARRGDDTVLDAELVIVTTDLDRSVSIPIPDDIRVAVSVYREKTT
jgi:4-hydroxybenzoyl-CoA thioesterase